MNKSIDCSKKKRAYGAEKEDEEIE